MRPGHHRSRVRRQDMDVARAPRPRIRPGRGPAGRGGPGPPDARGHPARQHSRHARGHGGGRTRRLRPVRHQHHPPRRRPGPRHPARRLPDRRHRPGTPAPAGRARPAGGADPRHVVAGVGRPARRGRCPAPAPRGRGHGHLHDDLHVGHERRSQTGPRRPPDGAVRGSEPHRSVRYRRHRRLLLVDAAVPFQRRPRRLERGHRQRRRHGPGRLLGVPVPRRHPPLRRDLHELRRQASRLRARDPRAAL